MSKSLSRKPECPSSCLAARGFSLRTLWRNLTCCLAGAVLVVFLVGMGVLPSRAATNPGGEYLVGPGDVISIVVYDNDDLKTKVRVASNGTIVVPLLGSVNVNKLSISAITDKLTKMFAAGYIVNPQVNVFVDEFRSRKVVVLGNVNKPGIIELSGPTTFLELISKAGGLDKDAGDTASIKRKVGDKDTVIPINLASLVKGGDLEQNIQINDEDTVYVSGAGKCYITGEVDTPGTYPCGENTTVLKLVALAKGFTGKAAKSSVSIIRMEGDQKNVLKDVSLDTLLLENDVIVVPESFF